MNLRNNPLLGLGLLLFVFLNFTACDEDSSNENAAPRLDVRLTDDPADYEAVIIDLEDVQLNYDGSSWVDLDTDYTGNYNLLDYTNGADTLIATSEMEAGTLNEVRLILGTDNFVVIDGDSIALRTPSAQQSGLKIKIENGELFPGKAYVLDLDFDAGRSVVRAGNSGNYNLKPVIRATFREVDLPVSGIAGRLNPAGMNYVFAYPLVGDTIGGYANEAGEFTLKPLPEGVYTLEIEPTENATYGVRKIAGVAVAPGQITDVGTLELE